MLSARIAATASALNIGFLFTSLCTVADIMFSERVLQSGGEVFVVLPVPQDKFLAYVSAPWHLGCGRLTMLL